MEIELELYMSIVYNLVFNLRQLIRIQVFQFHHLEFGVHHKLSICLCPRIHQELNIDIPDLNDTLQLAMVILAIEARGRASNGKSVCNN